jgi:hypothetical protein
VARVVGEPGRYSVWVDEDSWRPSRSGGSYTASIFALAVADVLTRRQLRGHVCGAACTEWLADDQPGERRPAPPPPRLDLAASQAEA